MNSIALPNSLEELKSIVSNCNLCELRDSRKQSGLEKVISMLF